MKYGEFALIVVVLLVNVAIFALWYTIPLIFSNLLDYNYALVSVLLAVIPAVEIIGSIPIGFYVDHGRAKGIGAVGTLFLILTPITFVIFSGISLIAMIFLGIGSITTEISLEAYIFNVIKKVKIKYIGIVYGLAGLGGLIGATAGGFLFQYYDIWYLLAFISTLLLLALALFIKYLQPLNTSSIKKRRYAYKILKEERSLYKKFRHFLTGLSIFSFVFGFFEWGVWLLVPLIITIRSADIFYGGIIYGVICLPFGFGSLLASRVYKRNNKRRIIMSSVGLSVIVMLSTSLLLGFSAYILILLLFASLSISIAYLALSGYILEKDRKDIAEFYVFETISYDAGGFVGILIAGFTVIATSITAVSIIFSVIAIAFLAYFSIISKDVR
jgi:predicted MFS family arabinose efflux permease